MRTSLFLALLCFAVSHSHTLHAQEWTLIWSDEFNYIGAPDPDKWAYDTGGGGWGNQESQYYTDRSENVRVDGEHLIIEARRESFGGLGYTSARVTTENIASFLYGRIEARLQVPAGIGTWPAFWMLPESEIYGSWPRSGEIDIMEHVGKNEGHLTWALHMEAFSGGDNIGDGVDRADATQSFYTFAVEWTPSSLTFYIDDEQIGDPWENRGAGTATWPYDHPFHIIFNTAIGGLNGGPDIDPAAFPNQFLIDYVRVYEATGELPQVSVVSPQPGATFGSGDQVVVEGFASDASPGLSEVRLTQADYPLAIFQGTSLSQDGMYAYTADSAQPGCYSIGLFARDEEGWTNTAESVEFTVGDAADCPQSPVTISAHAIPGVIEAEAYDMGGAGVAYSDLDVTNRGGVIRENEGVDVYERSDGSGFYLGAIGAREWTEYTVDISTAGVYQVDVLASAPETAGRIRLELDGEAVSDDLSFENTEQGDFWRTFSFYEISLPEGSHTLRVTMRSTSFELDSITFTETGSRPDVSMVQPTGDIQIAEGEDILLVATASDADGDLRSVRFLQGAATLVEVEAAPFQTTISGAYPGCYSIQAQSVDARGNSRLSEEVSSVVVGDGNCPRAPYLMRPHAVPGVIEAEFFDLGASGEAYADLTASNDGNAGIRLEDGVDISGTPAEGYWITSTANREWTAYTVQVLQEGSFSLTVRARAEQTASISIRIDGVDVTGSLSLAPTSGEWRDFVFPAIPFESGVHEVQIRMSGRLFEIDQISFSGTSTARDESLKPAPAFRLGVPSPNPAREFANVEVHTGRAGAATLSAWDVLGRQVWSVDLAGAGSRTVQIDTSNWTPGLYFLVADSPLGRSSQMLTVLR